MKKFISDVVIGLEVHVELSTNTKLFCGCATFGNDNPNSRTCEVCLGHPGSKPVLNKKIGEEEKKAKGDSNPPKLQQFSHWDFENKNKVRWGVMANFFR